MVNFGKINRSIDKKVSDEHIPEYKKREARPYFYQMNTNLPNPSNSAYVNNYFANSVDPAETAHNEPSHQDLHCLSFYSNF